MQGAHASTPVFVEFLHIVHRVPCKLCSASLDCSGAHVHVVFHGRREGGWESGIGTLSPVPYLRQRDMAASSEWSLDTDRAG